MIEYTGTDIHVRYIPHKVFWLILEEEVTILGDTY